MIKYIQEMLYLLNKHRNYAAIYSFTVQSFLLTINKAEILREENIKADTHKTILKRSIAKNKATGTSKWQKN